MNEELLNNIVGLYSGKETSPVQDLNAYIFDIESHIMSSIIKEFKEEQYTLLNHNNKFCLKYILNYLVNFE
jgi:hypothetical protein